MSSETGRCISVTNFQTRTTQDTSLLFCYCNCSLFACGNPPATHEWKEKSVPIQWQWGHDSSARFIMHCKCVNTKDMDHMVFWNKYQSLLNTAFNTYSSLPFSLQGESPSQRWGPGLACPRTLSVHVLLLCTMLFPVLLSPVEV